MPRTHPFRRAFIFDHGLGNLPGHWPTFHGLLVEQCRKFGLEPLIYGYKEIRRDLIGDLPVKPVFNIGPGAGLSPDIRENTRLCNRAFLEDLNRLDPADYSSQDLFIFSFVLNYELRAILEFSARFPSRNKPVFLVLLQFDNGLSVPDLPDLPLLVRFDRCLKRLVAGATGAERGQVVQLYREAFAGARPDRHLKRVAFMAPSDGLDTLFSSALGRVVRPYCMFAPPPDSSPSAGPGSGCGSSNRGGPTVCFLGHSCLRKGLQFVPQIVAAIHATQPEVRFDIQVNYNADYPLAHMFDGLFDGKAEGVTCYRGHLDNSTYYSILNRSDLVLFPYDCDVYRYMPSGLLREAVAAGKVVVVPDRSSLSRQALSVNAGAVTFAEFSAESVIAALKTSLACYDSLRAAAKAAAVRWTAQHNPDRFMEQLIEQATEAHGTD